MRNTLNIEMRNLQESKKLGKEEHRVFIVNPLQDGDYG